MKESDFLNELMVVKNSYKWEIRDNQIVGAALNGRDRGLYNPLTALCRTKRRGKFRTNLKESRRAAKALNVPVSVASAVVSKSNVGHSQVLKGRIRKVLL